MSFLGGIFGTAKAIEKGVGLIDNGIDHLASGLDKMNFSEQEKAVHLAKLTQMRMDQVKALQDEFTPRAITRRILAGVVYGNYFFHANLWLYASWRGMDDLKGACFELMKLETQLVLIVTFFYFGYYGVKSILKK